VEFADETTTQSMGDRTTYRDRNPCNGAGASERHSPARFSTQSTGQQTPMAPRLPFFESPRLSGRFSCRTALKMHQLAD